MTVGALLPNTTVAGFAPHPLHQADRLWPETNCYIDLWIELLHAMGLAPEAAFGFTARQDVEGDQFSFTKFPLEDLELLYELRVQELAIFEPVEIQAERQMARGRMCLIEVDPFNLPDTGVASYRLQHGKTTIAPNRLDRAGRRMEYFHNGGYFVLEGEDYDNLFAPAAEGERPFRPYVEFTNLEPRRRPDVELRGLAEMLWNRNIVRRPAANPVRAFQAAAPDQLGAIPDPSHPAFHDYAFHNLRLLGANFELMGAGLAWLHGGADPRIAHARQIAETAKAAQFRLARAVARKRFDGFVQGMDPAADAWDALFAAAPPIGLS